MGERIAVQEEEGRAVAAVAQVNPGAGGVDLGAGKPFEHVALLRLYQGVG
jgi:hypothetical protein